MVTHDAITIPNAPKYRVGFDPSKGRCLFAVVPIANGEVIMKCHLLILDKRDTKIALTTVLGDYFFTYDKHHTCMPFGDAMLMNHSDEPNADWVVSTDGNEDVFLFKAVADISIGEELCIGYGYEPVQFTKHKIRKQLNPKSVRNETDTVGRKNRRKPG